MADVKLCDHCGEKCYGNLFVTEDVSMCGEWRLDFCRWTCLLDYILENRTRQLEWGRQVEARAELGLDAWGDLPALKEIRYAA